MPNLGLLTVLQIMTQGCQIGKNPGLLNTPAGGTEAYSLTALKLFLHTISLKYDLPWLLTEASITTTNDYEISLSSLTRYRSIKTLLLDNLGEIYQSASYYDLWTKLKTDLAASTVPKGIPTEFYPTPDRSKLIVYPIPTLVYSGDLLYYRIPDYTTITSASTAASLDYEDSAGLVKVVEAFCKEWDGNNMAGMVEAIAERMFGQYRISSEDVTRQHGQNAVRLSPKYFNYRKDT